MCIQNFSNNDYLAEVAASNTVSTRGVIMNVTAIGITLNPAQKLAYLLPWKCSICFEISYMGLMHIAQQLGAIKWCQSDIVRKNDKLRLFGIDKAHSHEYNELDNSWRSSCCYIFNFIDDAPKDKEFNCCPKCGKPIKES